MNELAIVLVGLGIVTLIWAAHIALYAYSYSERGRAKKDRQHIQREVERKRAKEEANGDHPVRI